MARRPDLSNVLRRFLADVRGGTLTTFAVALVGLAGATGAAVDYANVSSQKRNLQAAADAAAINAAREFRLGNATAGSIELVARNYAQAALAKGGNQTAGGMQTTITPTADMTQKSVTVKIAATIPTYLMKVGISKVVSAEVKATAKVTGGSPICAIGLNPGNSKTIFLSEAAHLEAPGCAVYSDSKNSKGLFIQDQATLKAAFICSSGGQGKMGGGAYTPDPQVDCPAIPDPLASRPAPAVSGCDFMNKVVGGTTVETLNPGIYCGGLTVKDTAKVTLNPGTYVIKDGDLTVTDSASFSGVNVGFYLTGSKLNLKDKATVSLTAPKVGVMSGLLFFEDRATTSGSKHLINADNARTLLGTIYLAKGNLAIESNGPVADQSAYTIVVVDTFSLAVGPTMVLNANYGATDIPVPDGVGPNGTKTFLAN